MADEVLKNLKMWISDPLCVDAARRIEDDGAEIERLRVALKEIARRMPKILTGADGHCGDIAMSMGIIARDALSGYEPTRMWCESCGRISSDGTCDCTKFGRAPKFVPYDEQSQETKL
jgi:hypothetical protein